MSILKILLWAFFGVTYYLCPNFLSLGGLFTMFMVDCYPWPSQQSL